MQAAVLVALLAAFLSAVRGAEDQSGPDLVSMVTSLQNQVRTLQESLAQLQNGPRVAFFAAFCTDSEEGTHGPFNGTTTIRYKNVLTNVGKAYSTATGAFSAPVRGLYVFHFSLFNGLSAPVNAVASLRRNGVKVAYAFDTTPSDANDSSTRVAVVTLEAGDSVYVELQAGSYFYDRHGDHNSFSGFLLSTM